MYSTLPKKASKTLYSAYRGIRGIRRCVYPCFPPVLGPSLVQQVAVRSKMAELQANCQLLFSQVSNMRSAASSPSPDTEVSLLNSSTSVNFVMWDVHISSVGYGAGFV
jgi:hypothetical protein